MNSFAGRSKDRTRIFICINESLLNDKVYQAQKMNKYKILYYYLFRFWVSVFLYFCFRFYSIFSFRSFLVNNGDEKMIFRVSY